MPVRGASWVKTAASEKTRSRKVARRSSTVNNFNPFVTIFFCMCRVLKVTRAMGASGPCFVPAERQKFVQSLVEALQFGNVARREVRPRIGERGSLAANLCDAYHGFPAKDGHADDF